MFLKYFALKTLTELKSEWDREARYAASIAPS